MPQQLQEPGTTIDGKFMNYEELNSLTVALKDNHTEKMNLIGKMNEEGKIGLTKWIRDGRDREEAKYREEERRKNDMSDPKNIPGLWDPITNSYNNTFYDIQDKYGTFVAGEALKHKKNGDKYPDEIRDFMTAIAYKKVTIEEANTKGIDAYTEFKEGRKADYHFQKKQGDRLDRDINSEMDLAMGVDPYEKTAKPVEEVKEVQEEVPKKTKKSVDVRKYFFQDVKNSTPIKNEVFNNMENTTNDDVFYSPMFLLLYILKKRPFPGKKDKHKTYNHWYREKNLIVIAADKVEVSKELNIKYRTIARWYNLLIKQHLVLPIKSKGETIYIIGYIKDNEEFLLYEFDRDERVLEYNKLGDIIGN